MHGKGTQTHQQLQREVKRAQELIDNRDFDEAKERLLRIRAEGEAASLGVDVHPVPFAMPGVAQG